MGTLKLEAKVTDFACFTLPSFIITTIAKKILTAGIMTFYELIVNLKTFGSYIQSEGSDTRYVNYASRKSSINFAF